MEIITRRAIPQEWSELPPSYRPLYVDERDIVRVVEEDGQIHLRNRRTRVVECLTPDQQSTVVPYDLGPATGDEPIVIPCGQAVEIAELWDLLEWYSANLHKRQQREKDVEPGRTAAFLEALAQEQDELDKRVVGATTVGPHYRVQREAP